MADALIRVDKVLELIDARIAKAQERLADIPDERRNHVMFSEFHDNYERCIGCAQLDYDEDTSRATVETLEELRKEVLTS